MQHTSILVSRHKREIASVNKMLYEQCKILETLNDEKVWTPEVKSWWTKRKEEERKKAEALRAKLEKEREEKLKKYFKLKEELGI